MSWAQRLKRVFSIDLDTCTAGGRAVRIIGCIEDPVVIEKILAHLDAKAASANSAPSLSEHRSSCGYSTCGSNHGRGRGANARR